jgi:hypothetical protein
LSVVAGFVTVGLGLWWTSPGSAPELTASQRSGLEIIPLATMIDTDVEIGGLFGLNQTYNGNLAVASDHQVAIAAADSEAASPSVSVVSESHPDSPQPPESADSAITISSLSSSPTPQSRLEVRLEDGSRIGARVIASRSGVALVELEQRPGSLGRKLATSVPAASDVVILLTERPRRLTYGQLLQTIARGGFQLAGGTAVVSLDGELLGICVEDTQSEHTRFVTAAELADASAP